jgi:hypothetical protein
MSPSPHFPSCICVIINAEKYTTLHRHLHPAAAPSLSDPNVVLSLFIQYVVWLVFMYLGLSTILLSVELRLTECCGRMGNIAAFVGGPGFGSRPGDQLS